MYYKKGTPIRNFLDALSKDFWKKMDERYPIAKPEEKLKNTQTNITKEKNK